LEIPRPGVGYWQKKLYGKQVTRLSLPQLKEPNEVVIRLLRQEKVPLEQEQDAEAQAKITFEKLDENRIRVATRLLSPHPLVVITEKILRRAKPDITSVVKRTREKCLGLCINPKSLDRVLRIMDALIKALEKRGSDVSIVKEDEHNPYSRFKTSVSVLGERLDFSLRESFQQTDHIPPPSGRKGGSTFSSFHYAPKYDYKPSGRFSLMINGYIGTGVRANWSDGKKQQLEDCLNSFVIGLINAAVATKAQRIERERWERERRESEQRREEMARLRRKEEARLQSLEKEVESWQKSKNIRAYIEAVKEVGVRKHGEIAPGSQLDQWLSWAHQQADHLDPLAEHPSSDLNKKDEQGLDY
jgi:hypothetical protein